MGRIRFLANTQGLREDGEYRKGDRVELVEYSDISSDIHIGEKGTIMENRRVERGRTACIAISWDNGSIWATMSSRFRLIL